MSRRGGRGRRPQPARPPSLDGFKPVRITTGRDTEEPAEETKRVEVFSIDDRAFTVPVELPPATGLRYLRNVRDQGRDFAVAELLTEAMGEEAFEALAECDDVGRDEMGIIVDIVMSIAMGAVDPGKD